MLKKKEWGLVLLKLIWTQCSNVLLFCLVWCEQTGGILSQLGWLTKLEFKEWIWVHISYIYIYIYIKEAPSIGEKGLTVVMGIEEKKVVVDEAISS